MIAETADRFLTVFVPGWVLDSRSLAPPARGDVIDVALAIYPAGPTPSPCARTVRATVRPLFGRILYSSQEGAAVAARGAR
ncbi:hypothetical protein [Rhodococcus sp. 1168]|uniref:hypothetical protein n=1 Tax=Rhodococcus sp. 1168 TaxID=2018041 RepID=UPI000A0B733A|nr:hypothetical protein [Rhodococcus sp. 1168]ORI15811.1 hypothetical protein BJI47_00525 [Rhodococcus sp. 1168]